MGILDDLKDLVGGSDEQAAAKRQEGLGGALRAAPTNLGQAVNTAVAFSPINDVSSTIGMATGADPVTGYRQSKEERGLGFATLFGFAGAASAMGVLVNGGKIAKRLEHAMDAGRLQTAGTERYEAIANTIRRRQEQGISRQFEAMRPSPDALENIAGFGQRGTQMLPVERTLSELAAANQPVSLYASNAVNGFLNYRDTHAWLETAADTATGYARHASILSRTQNPVALARADGFVRAIAPRLANTTHYKATNLSTLQGDDLERAHIAIAGFELSRFNAALEKDILGATAKHKKGRIAKQAWEKLRNGDELAPKEIETLSDVMEAFADSVWMFDSPELTGTPLATLKKVDVEGPEPKYSMTYKMFEAISEDMLTWKEANRRMSALYAGDPMAMVPINTEQITNFTKKYVTDEIMEYNREWYPKARVDTGAAADRVGWDHERFIVTTAIMSPGQSWDTNVPKAEAFARAMADYDAGKFKTPLKKSDVPPEIQERLLDELHDLGIKPKKGQIDDGSEITRLWVAIAKGDYSNGQGQFLPLDSAALAVMVAKAKDPWAIFTKGTTRSAATKGGLPAGLKVKDMKRMFESGEADADTLFAMRYNNPDQQLKVPSFTHAIANSGEEDLNSQAEYMAKMMNGGGPFRDNLTDDEVMKSLRGELPVVVDRQAFKVANGMSILPDTFLSSQKGVFDALAQAYRNAALELGVVKALGRHLLPEELQAITWIQYRELGNVKFDAGELPKGFQPERTMNTELNRMRGERRWKAGYKRPTPNTVLAGYKEGAGADFIWDRGVYDLITGNADGLPWHGVDALDSATDYSYGQVWVDPDNIFDEVSPEGRDRAVSPVRDVSVHMAPDGSMKILAGDRPTVYGALDARYPALGKVEIDGQLEQLMLRSKPVVVGDAKKLYDRLNDMTVHRANPELRDNTGAALHFTNPPDTLGLTGNHMWVSTVESMNEGDQFGLASMQQVQAELAQAGINAQLKVTDSYLGITRPPLDPDTLQPAWAPEEARRGAILSFDTNDDLQAAAQWMLLTNEDGIPNFKRIFQEDVLDSRYYVDGPTSAPPGTTMVFEHHFRDPQGRELVNLNTAGDKFWSNTRTVYLPDEMAQFVTPARTAGLEVGAPMHTIDPWAQVPPLDGLEVRSRLDWDTPDKEAWSGIETRTPFDIYEVRTRNADGTYGDWKKATEFALYIPDDGPPQVAIGTDTIPGVDPQRIVVVRKGAEPEFVGKGRKKGEIKRDKKTKKEIWHEVVQMSPYRNADGKIDGVYGRDVYELMRRIGFTGAVRLKQWERT